MRLLAEPLYQLLQAPRAGAFAMAPAAAALGAFTVHPAAAAHQFAGAVRVRVGHYSRASTPVRTGEALPVFWVRLIDTRVALIVLCR